MLVPRPESAITTAKESHQRRRKTHWILSVVVAAFALFATFVAGHVYVPALKSWIDIELSDLGFRSHHEAKQMGVVGLVSNVPGAIRGWAQSDDATVETLHLDIKFEQFRQLQTQRTAALNRGIIYSSEKEFVPARIRWNGSSYKCKLRLKGDITDHIDSDRWSFRVHVENGHLFSMSRFSLQHPKTRGFQSEPLAMSAFKDADILAPRYRFVRVVVNGERLGMMALEEHFSKELLESQQRREGPIIKFDETICWEQAAHSPASAHFESQPIVAFQSTSVLADETQKRCLQQAVGLLKGFINDKNRAADVFDVRRMAKFIAISELWGIWHGLETHNLRFYFNPITARLEPVAYDCNSHLRWQPSGYSMPLLAIQNDSADLVQKFQRQPDAWAAFVEELGSLAQQYSAEDWLERFRRRDGDWLTQLQSEFVFLQPHPFHRFPDRIDQVNAAIANKPAFTTATPTETFHTL